MTSVVYHTLLFFRKWTSLLMTMTFIAITVLASLIAGFAAGRGVDKEEFWINGGRTGLYKLVATIVSTQVGGGIVVGVVASTYAHGTGFGVVALASTVGGMLALILLAKVANRRPFDPGVFTLPDMIGARLGKSAELAAGIVVSISYLGLLASQYVAMGALLGHLGGLSFWNGLWIASLGSILYSAFSGIRGDIEADGVLFLAMAVGLVAALRIVATMFEAADLGAIPREIWSPVTFGGHVYLVGGVLLGAIVPVVSSEFWIRIFASSESKNIGKGLALGAIVVIPFYTLPILLGLATAALLPGRDANSVFAVALEIFGSPVLSSLALTAVVAAVLSTANTYSLVAIGALTRNVFRSEKDNLRLQKAAIVAVGLAGLGAARLTPDIAALLLDSLYMQGALLPAILIALFRWKANRKITTASIAAGAATAGASYPLLGPTAFVPTLAVSIFLAAIALLIGESPSPRIDG